MNIKVDAIKKYKQNCLELIKKGSFEEALNIASKYPLGLIICKKRLLNEYCMPKDKLEVLCMVEKKNPHYSTASPMKLYLEDEVRLKFQLKIKQKNK
jgi:hypothetical protein